MEARRVAFIISLFCVLGTNCFKILGVFPTLNRNNHLTYRELFRELASRNHEVTLLTHFPSPNPPDNFKEILLSDNPVNKVLSFDSVVVNEVSRVPLETLLVTKDGNDGCKMLMNNHNVLYMIRSRPKFDVIIAESYNSDCALAFAANLSAPYIAFNPYPVQPWHYSRLGINFNAAHVPQANLPYGRNPWYLERVKSFILYYVSNFVFYVSSHVVDHVFLYKYLGDDLPEMESLAANASLVFVNTHQSLYGGTPRSDNVIDIGGIHVREPKILPTAIQQFINEAEHGVIYMNLGSTVSDSTFPEDKLKELLATFSKLPYRILWKWNGHQINNLPSNVLTMRWFPQYDILRQDNVKAFISSAGILSTIEAVDSGVPMVAVPLFHDDFGNAAAMVDADLAVMVNYEDFRSEILLDAINDVLEPRVQQRAKMFSRIWHDRTSSPLQTVIYWTEYVARYGGAPNLPATSNFKPMYQLYQWDVFAFLGVVLFAMAYVFYKILCLCCCCFPSKETSNVEYRSDGGKRRVKFE